MKLSKTQQVVLDRMEPGRWYSAYDLQSSLSTLRALSNKSELEEKRTWGSLFSPSTNIWFRKPILEESSK